VNNTNRINRSFEYLAASTSTYTRSPGKQSFTSALIWALEKLAHHPPREALQASPMFTTSKLAKTIWECPDFPKEQKPSLTTRDVEAWQHIILAPLPADGVASLTPAQNSEDEDECEEEDEDDKPNDQFLSLTFHFKHKQDESELLKKLADHLKKFMRVEPSLHKVQWCGLWGGLAPPPGHRWRDAVRKLKMLQGRSPISPAFPSVNAQNDRLSTQAAHHPQYSPNDERTPLLSDTTSETIKLPDETTSSSFWGRISALFQSFRRSTSADLRVEPASTVSHVGRKDSQKWARRLVERLRSLFYHPTPRVEISS
jgi:hypothetical protein